jgi:hypothetical protein
VLRRERGHLGETRAIVRGELHSHTRVRGVGGRAHLHARGSLRRPDVVPPPLERLGVAQPYLCARVGYLELLATTLFQVHEEG